MEDKDENCNDRKDIVLFEIQLDFSKIFDMFEGFGVYGFQVLFYLKLFFLLCIFFIKFGV